MSRCLNSNVLKIIAISAMVLDHVAISFLGNNLSLYIIFRMIGRVCAPIMFMGIANGFRFTSNKFKYGMRLLVFAIISQIPYSLYKVGTVFMFDFYNIIFTLFLGFMCLYALVDIKNIFYRLLLVFLCFSLVCFCDYGIFALVMILMFYFCNSKNLKIVCYCLISLIYIVYRTFISESILTFIVFNGLFLTVPLLVIYNGKKGKYNLKYLFYMFYPVHLLVIYFISTLL